MARILSWWSAGEGPPVVALPSLGRPASDFEDLSPQVLAAGYRLIGVDLHGIGESALPADEDTLQDLAADVVATIAEAIGADQRVHLIGHAFGNRVARCVSADHPEIVRSLTVLGCGGKVPGDGEALAALIRCFDPSLDRAAHRAAVATAFFAPGNDVSPRWLQGWSNVAAGAQRSAMIRTPVDHWWLPPAPIPVLAVVGTEDRIAPPANARMLVDRLGERGRLVEVEAAGHALLPERPSDLGDSLLTHLAAT